MCERRRAKKAIITNTYKSNLSKPFFEIEIVNYFQKEGLVAEIYYENEQWAEICPTNDGTRIKIYPPHQGGHWDFPYQEATKAIERACTRLTMARNKGSCITKTMPIEPNEVNKEAEQILEEIVNHPEKQVLESELARFGKVVDICCPNRRGARFSLEGEFICFLEF